MSGENTNSTGTAELQSFGQLSEADQSAIRWRSELKSFRKISELLQADYGLDRAERTVSAWFRPNGRLYQAHVEWRQMMAEAQVHEVSDRLKLSTEVSFNRLMRIISPEQPDDDLALKAIKVHLDKTVPNPKSLIELEVSSTDEAPMNDYLAASVGKWQKVVDAGQAALAVKEDKDVQTES